MNHYITKYMSEVHDYQINTSEVKLFLQAIPDYK